MTAPTIGSYESAGLRLSFREFGEQNAPIVVVYHGFLDCAEAWDSVVAPLVPQFRIIALDARGHGDSEWVGSGGAYWFPDYVLDLVTLLESLGVSDESPCALVGHSMGGAVWRIPWAYPGYGNPYCRRTWPAEVSLVSCPDSYAPVRGIHTKTSSEPRARGYALSSCGRRTFASVRRAAR